MENKFRIFNLTLQNVNKILLLWGVCSAASTQTKTKRDKLFLSFLKASQCLIADVGRDDEAVNFLSGSPRLKIEVPVCHLLCIEKISLNSDCT